MDERTTPAEGEAETPFGALPKKMKQSVLKLQYMHSTSSVECIGTKLKMGVSCPLILVPQSVTTSSLGAFNKFIVLSAFLCQILSYVFDNQRSRFNDTILL